MADDETTASDVLRLVAPDVGAEQQFLDVLREALDVLERAAIPHALMGGLAIAVLGRPRWTHDIDIFVRPDDARRALGAFEEAGFDVEETNPMWLFKATKSGVLVDLIFRSHGTYFDDEMLRRSVETAFKGERVRLLPPEDLIVIKVSAFAEHAGYHWFDALALLATSEIDWDYLLFRSRRAVRGLLSLLAYAQAEDIAVPDSVVERLFHSIYAEGASRPSTEAAAMITQTDPEAHGAQSLRDRLRNDHRVCDVDVDVAEYENTILITGEVATPERQEALTAVVSELVPGRRVDNRTTIRSLSDRVGIEEMS
ncbi:MAG: nucleotidyltransferase family protein [Actinomycetota bacterium]|nr:nucleotidyltransferase family protein [Actinomycetota bacterium]